jgi:hypothetical protein
MNEEQLKSAVLAKCEELAPNCGETYTTPKGTALRTNDRQIGDSCNQWRLDEYRESSWVAIAIDDNAPSDSWVWAIAADILGIKQPEPIPLPQAIANIATDALGLPRVVAVASNQPLRPFDALLWEAFEMHAPREWVMLDEFMGHKNVPCTQVRASSKKRFSEWLATLPPDTLKADRELVVDAFEREDLERDLLNERYNYELINAIKRLSGMEVEND